MSVDEGGFTKCYQHKGEDPAALAEQNRAMQPHYSLKLDKDTGSGQYNKTSYEGTADLTEELWEEAHGQPYTDPLA